MLWPKLVRDNAMLLQCSFDFDSCSELVGFLASVAAAVCVLLPEKGGFPLCSLFLESQVGLMLRFCFDDGILKVSMQFLECSA